MRHRSAALVITAALAGCSSKSDSASKQAPEPAPTSAPTAYDASPGGAADAIGPLPMEGLESFEDEGEQFPLVGAAPDRTVAPRPVGDRPELASIEELGRVTFWRGAKPMGSARFPGKPEKLAFSPDGSVLAVATDDTAIHLIDVDRRKRVATLPRSSQLEEDDGTIEWLAWLDDRRLSSFDGQTAVTWDMTERRRPHVAYRSNLPREVSGDIAVDRDGRRAVVAFELGSYAYDDLRAKPRRLDWIPEHVAFGGDAGFVIGWGAAFVELPAAAKIAVPPGGPDYTKQAPNVSIGAVREAGLLVIRRTKDYQRLRHRKLIHHLTGAAAAARAPLVAYARDHRHVVVENLETGVPIREVETGETRDLWLTPDGSYLVVFDLQGIGVWRVADGVRTITADFSDVRLSPDGRQLATIAGDSLDQIAIYELATGKPVRQLALADEAEIIDLAWSPRTAGGQTVAYLLSSR